MADFTMRILSGSQVAACLSDLVYAKKQVGDSWVDLTVGQVLTISQGGSLDFGGSEFQECQTELIQPAKQAEDDKYGWWHLQQGAYQVQFNESLTLKEGLLGELTPHPRLIAAGSSHPAVHLAKDDALKVVLWVPSSGLSLKENCRLSRLQLFQI